jgi:hypothetical protein
MTDNKSERLEMRVDETFLEKVDDWRRKEPDIPPRAEAVRRLVELGLSYDPALRPNPRVSTTGFRTQPLGSPKGVAKPKAK